MEQSGSLNLACVDWAERIRERRSLIPDGARDLNKKEEARARAIFGRLRLPDVPETPALRDAAGEWFQEIVGVFLGAVDQETGGRLIRELFLLAPKKSSKTSYGAALMMTALLMNQRPRAEFLLVAPTQAIAELAYKQAAGMVACDPDGFLRKRMHVQEHLKAITDRRTKAQLRIKTFDTSVLTGVKPAGVLLDELHEIARASKASRIIGQLRGGLLPTPEAFLAFITTQSDEAPMGAFGAELKLARAVRDGQAKASVMPVLYEFPREMVEDRSENPAWAQPRNWPMVTPNLDRSVTLDRLISEFEAAKQKGEEETRRWTSQHLNIEIGVALRSDRWEGADHWAACANPALTLEEIIARCDVAVAGIDGGGLDDLLGLGILGRDRDTRDWLLWTHAWVHRKVLSLRKEIAPALLDFEKEGTLTIYDTPGDDVAELVEFVSQVKDADLFPDKHAIGVDVIGISEITDELALQGMTSESELVVAVTQGWKLANTIKTTARRLAAGTMWHCGTRLMNWCVGNAKVEPRGNAILITKQTAGTAKIDPLMATFSAVALMAKNPEAAKQFIYAGERDELRFV